jgi:hypothetical protein
MLLSHPTARISVLVNPLYSLIWKGNLRVKNPRRWKSSKRDLCFGTMLFSFKDTFIYAPLVFVMIVGQSGRRIDQSHFFDADTIMTRSKSFRTLTTRYPNGPRISSLKDWNPFYAGILPETRPIICSFLRK